MKRVLFYVLSWTWGIVLNTVGHLIALVLLCCGVKPYRYAGCICFPIGKDWGGASIGNVIMHATDCGTPSILEHEFGHAIQNCIFGPLCILLVTIPSGIRYQYRNYLVRTGRRTCRELPNYYSIWFESQATKLGRENIINWRSDT